MPQYFLAVNHTEADAARLSAMTPEQMQPMFDATATFNDALKAQGAWVFAGGLHPRDVATVVDATGRTPVVTEGPFSDASTYLGGFWVIEATDHDAALAWATLGSQACGGAVEVRPFQG